MDKIYRCFAVVLFMPISTFTFMCCRGKHAKYFKILNFVNYAALSFLVSNSLC